MKSGTGDDVAAGTAAGAGEGVPRGTAGADASSARADVAAPLARWFLWADSPAAVQRVIVGLGALCAALFVFDIFWHRHAYVPGEGLWGYHAIAGFVSFTVIVLGAKALRTVIRRDEDYYAPKAIDAEAYPDPGLERLAAGEGEDAAKLLEVRDGDVVGTHALDTGAPAGGTRASAPAEQEPRP